MKRKQRKQTPRLEHALHFAEQIRDRLESRPPKRARRVLTCWTEDEYHRLAEAAATHNAPIATLVHTLTLAGLDALNRAD